MLTCTRCKAEKPMTSEFFPLHNGKKNGLDSWCRSCRSSYRSEIRRGAYRSSVSDEVVKSLLTIKECVICGDESNMKVDHCHKTGSVRGVLCNRCNLGLGHFRDDPELLEFARIYLLASQDDPEANCYLQTASDPNSRINKSLRAWNC